MTFFGRIRGMFGDADRSAPADEQVRNRIFSASQFRDAELARAAGARARAEAKHVDAAEVLSPAINPIAETLIAAEPELTEAVTKAPVAPPAPATDPMDWEEAVGWLSQRTTEARNFVGQYWNWDHDLRVLHFLAQQPDLDAGVAAHIFWLTAACEDYFPFGDDEPDSEISRQVAWLTDFLGRRFAEGAFLSASYGFDDSWDCERLKEHLGDLHADGRLGWSPDAIPTSSPAGPMGFDDIPEGERADVTEFLARFGVY